MRSLRLLELSEFAYFIVLELKAINGAALQLYQGFHDFSLPCFHALGRTSDNRLLHITFTLRAEGTHIRVISARNMHRKERARSQRSLIDPQLEQALVRADQLGPWEQQVMENATILGRYYRGWLSEPVQNILDNSQQRLARLYPHRAKQLERQYLLP